jgi:hypothetical protein
MDKTDPNDIVQRLSVRRQLWEGYVKTDITVNKHRDGVKTNCEAGQT